MRRRKCTRLARIFLSPHVFFFIVNILHPQCSFHTTFKHDPVDHVLRNMSIETKPKGHLLSMVRKYTKVLTLGKDSESLSRVDYGDVWMFYTDWSEKEPRPWERGLGLVVLLLVE